MTTVRSVVAQGLPMSPMIEYLGRCRRITSGFRRKHFSAVCVMAGYEEGKNAAVECRRSHDRIAGLPAGGLARRRVAAIAAFSPVSVRDAKKETSCGLRDRRRHDRLGHCEQPEPASRKRNRRHFLKLCCWERFDLLSAIVPSGRPIAILNDPNSPESNAQSHAARISQRTPRLCGK